MPTFFPALGHENSMAQPKPDKWLSSADVIVRRLTAVQVSFCSLINGSVVVFCPNKQPSFQPFMRLHPIVPQFVRNRTVT